MRPVLFLGICAAAIVAVVVCSAAPADAGNGFSIRSAPVCIGGSCGSSVVVQQQVPQVIVQQAVPEIIVQQQQVPVVIQQNVPQIRVNSCFRSRVSVRRGLFGGLRVRVR